MESKIRGSVIKARKRFAEDHFGEGAWERLISAMTEEDRAVLGGLIVAAGWYSFETGERLDRAIVDVLGGGDQSVFEEIGRKSARENLGGVHASFIKPGDPQGFLAQTKSIYKFYYSSGSREYEQTGPASGVITTRDAEDFSVADCLTVIGWHKEALALCGASNVRITETQCRARGDAVCRYELAWG
ncbi:DUF2378 family protein [bacterium]|nr:DUF2378 family protein [bacterium]